MLADQIEYRDWKTTEVPSVDGLTRRVKKPWPSGRGVFPSTIFSNEKDPIVSPLAVTAPRLTLEPLVGVYVMPPRHNRNRRARC